MLKITTLNSVYEVRHNGTVFQVKKVGGDCGEGADGQIAGTIG